MNDKKAAEKAFDKWWKKADRYGWSLQTSWPDAYVAGMRAQRQRLRSFTMTLVEEAIGDRKR